MPTSRADTRSPLKPVEFLLLAVLYDDPRHGYGIVQQIDERTHGRVQLRPGDVYRVIYRLAQRGLLVETDRRADDAGAERRTYYAITEAGRELAHAEAEMLSEVSSALVSKAAAQRGR
ncbi:MAG: PadR family transcriptional regulator [Acidobacteria bacterium]|nr:PadR family transcriptional regulator [Acidobacteriota bacterium]